jgi:hypothetical protein
MRRAGRSIMQARRAGLASGTQEDPDGRFPCLWEVERLRCLLDVHKDKVTQRYAHLAPMSLDKLTEILERKPKQKPRHLGIVSGGQG